MFSRFLPGTLRQWHWISSAVCLVGMILFAFTGITLNHAADIPADPERTTVEAELSPGMLSAVQSRSEGPLPMAVRRWLSDEHDIPTPDAYAEWDEYEVYLGMPKPGGDAWLSIDLETGSFIYENTDRGVISYLNDLHKGRNTNTAWSWFIDIFSVLCLVFSLSGLWLLARYARQRPSTWPLVAFGVIAPIILLVLAAH
ncbi:MULTISPECIES: PepSY-associated TM helix domain-containing protein [unclassified Thalassolituus]|uniref:PepSY-associated TM helix domain-containing protein n=1 Tax=unclassified Thalassolituus TaxID=2624967 RepID=UPI002630161D|nr:MULTISPECIES: PepSY-associated TM helix domain-containing protein [unclassified Thalassolituus]MEE3191778.1 PepSY-associated TM helix domain-containing protein [Pseudomonadota bacterium]MEE3209661.1 PepSY-associated TM helix domain-containing protein [Pseudomonadota bacterium]